MKPRKGDIVNKEIAFVYGICRQKRKINMKRKLVFQLSRRISYLL